MLCGLGRQACRDQKSPPGFSSIILLLRLLGDVLRERKGTLGITVLYALNWKPAQELCCGDVGSEEGVKSRAVPDRMRRVKSASSGGLPRGVGTLSPVLTTSRCRDGQGGAQARDDLCHQEPGSVPPPATLSHPVGSRGTGLAPPGPSSGGPEIGEMGHFQKWPHLTLDTPPSYFERSAPHQSEQSLLWGRKGDRGHQWMYLSCSWHSGPAKYLPQVLYSVHHCM